MILINKIKLFIKRLFCKHNDYDVYLSFKPHYRAKGNIFNNKDSYVLRYNVYETFVCKNCKKHIHYKKIHSNIKYNTIITKYGIKL